MVSRIALLAAVLAPVVSAGPCKPVVLTLPSTGNVTADLPSPPTNVTVKRIAVGHGIQNYTCASANATGAVPSKGALAVLYDVTPLYPGTPNTGLDQATWDSLSATVLFGQNIPLNLSPNALPEAEYSADVANPFPAAADLSINGLPTLPFLGHHFFDKDGIPTFDLSAADLLASVARLNGANAPTDANPGIIGTGAVPWLQLKDNTGVSRGLQYVYRVVTAGGVAQACSVAGEGSGSVPYTAFYWFLGA
ncbi:hypothetical protein GQ53DRAFT_672855 [Thozetella sp. PMI_491]|nr:hypothetical protein GQ53DRAFT_672855 [Thozetella sp. PMI_491]